MSENSKIFERIIDEDLAMGHKMHDLMEKLFPICRSITGNGLRKSLKILQEIIPLKIIETPTNTQVYDWKIPKEWNINDAYIKNSKGEKIIDFQKSNLHVLNYSVPINKKISFEELKSHVFTLENNPDVIPYRTSYYQENWGFCMSHKQFLEMKDDEYEVFIDSKLESGSMSYGEYFIQGESDKEVLLSCYPCHPSMCNDNLSGVVLLTYIANCLKNLSLKYSYRFLFVPEKIGAITWLSRNEKNTKNISHGLVATCLGDAGISTYKKSRQGNAEIDKITLEVLTESGEDFNVIDFAPIGSDERQFCSPGFNLPIGSLARTLAPHFKEYHTSNDNLDFVKAEFLGNTFKKYLKIISKLEQNFSKNIHSENKIRANETKNGRLLINTNPKCEPQLGKRNLYHAIGAQTPSQAGQKISNQLASLWILNYSDGKHSLSEIAELSGYDMEQLENMTDILIDVGLLKEMKKNA